MRPAYQDSYGVLDEAKASKCVDPMDVFYFDVHGFSSQDNEKGVAYVVGTGLNAHQLADVMRSLYVIWNPNIRLTPKWILFCQRTMALAS